jgi:hypothetical protein
MSCFFFLNGWISLEPAPFASARLEAFGIVSGVSSSVYAQRKPPSYSMFKVQSEVTKLHLILPVLFQALTTVQRYPHGPGEKRVLSAAIS